MDLTFIQLGALICAALIAGFSKTGIPTTGILGVTIMASFFAAKSSVGMLLPMLIVADIVAVIYYRRQVIWKHLISLVPWVLIGILSGYVLMRIISDTQLKLVIGLIVFCLVIIHFVRERRGNLENPPAHWGFSAFMGMMAGFATMVGNAAGGVMAIYLLSRRLPKEQFIGTGAWFFLSVNLFKVPFNVALGTITWESLLYNLMMVPVILLGTWIGIKIVPKLSQSQFQYIVLILSLIGSLQLIISSVLTWF